MTIGLPDIDAHRYYCISSGLCQPLLNVHSNYSSSWLKDHSIWLQISTIAFFVVYSNHFWICITMIAFHDHKADRYSCTQILLHFFWSLSTTSECAFQLQFFFMTEGPLNMVTDIYYCILCLPDKVVHRYCLTTSGLCQPILPVHSNYSFHEYRATRYSCTNVLHCCITSGLCHPLQNFHFNYNSLWPWGQ